jgi:hypothetical protein
MAKCQLSGSSFLEVLEMCGRQGRRPRLGQWIEEATAASCSIKRLSWGRYHMGCYPKETKGNISNICCLEIFILRAVSILKLSDKIKEATKKFY